MRQPVIFAIACAASAAAAAPRHAPSGGGDKAKPIEVGPMLDKLDVYRDELGDYYVTPRPGTLASSDDYDKWLFFGNDKAMYQQIVVGSSNDGTHFEWNLWSPRAKDLNTANLNLKDGKLTLQCRVRESRALTQLKADDAKALLRRAKLYPKLWRRRSKFIARDDDGVYYFVDQLQEEYGGNGYRVFVGQKGSMKEMPMTNMVSDSAGEIYATRTGQLKIIAGRDGKAYWIKGGKKVELTVLPPIDNRYLIYRELGIYGQLGVVCDDL
jgi:hypothetical protein